MTDQAKPQGMICKANGCPLCIDYVTDWHEPKGRHGKPVPKWGVCKYHKAAPASQWTATTAIILRLHSVMRMRDMVSNCCDPLFRHHAGESVDHWLDRIGREIDQQIIPVVSDHPEQSVRSFDSLRSMLTGNFPQDNTAGV